MRKVAKSSPEGHIAPFPEDVLSLIFSFLYTTELSEWISRDPVTNAPVEGPTSATFSSLKLVNSFFYAIASKYEVRTLFRPDVIQRRALNVARRQHIRDYTRCVVLSDHSTKDCQAHHDRELGNVRHIDALVVRSFCTLRGGIWHSIHHDLSHDLHCGFVTTLRPRKLVVHHSTVIFPRVLEEPSIPEAVLDAAATHVYVIDATNIGSWTEALSDDKRNKEFMGGIGGLTPLRAAKLLDLVIIFPVDPRAPLPSECVSDSKRAWKMLADALAEFIALVPPTCNLTVVNSAWIDATSEHPLPQFAKEEIFRARLDHHFARRKHHRFTPLTKYFHSRGCRDGEARSLAARQDTVQFLSLGEFIRHWDWVDVFEADFAAQFLRGP